MASYDSLREMSGLPVPVAVQGNGPSKVFSYSGLHRVRVVMPAGTDLSVSMYSEGCVPPAGSVSPMLILYGELVDDARLPPVFSNHGR